MKLLRRLLLGALLVLGLATLASAQNANTTTIRFAGVPSGSCGLFTYAVNNATGDFYDCLTGVWTKVSGGGGGAPSGPAGGALSGTYPNPGLANITTGQPVGGTSSSGVGTILTLNVDLFPNGGCSTTSGGTTTTQLDCAFYKAVDQANASQNNVALILGNNFYNTCKELVFPTGGFWTVDVIGQSQRTSFVNKTCSTPTLPVFSNPASGAQSVNMELRHFTVQANGDANSCMDIANVINSLFDDLACNGVLSTGQHLMQFGSNFSTGGAFQSRFTHINASGYSTLNPAATITANVVGGAITSYTVSNGGSGYPTFAPDIQVFVLGYGAGFQPCTVMPTGIAATQSGGVITGVTNTTNGSGCTGTIYVNAGAVSSVLYGIDFGATSDSVIDDVIVVGAGSAAGIHVFGGNNTLSHAHPTNDSTGLLLSAGDNDSIWGTECDGNYHLCMDFEGSDGLSVEGTNVYTDNFFRPGTASFYFGAGAANIAFGAQSNQCTAGTVPTGWHEFVTQAGPYDLGNPLPAGVSVFGNDQACVNIGNVAGFPSSLIGTAVASATTIALTNQIQHVTGTTPIATITAPNGFSSTVGGCVTLIADGAWTTTTAGNIRVALNPAIVNASYQFCYDGSKWDFQPNGSSVGAFTSIATGTSPPTCTPGTGGAWCGTEGTAPTAASSVDDIHMDSTQHAAEVNNNNTGEMALSRVGCANVTPVTVAANVTTDQNLQACTLSANLLNVVGRTLRIYTAGVYSTAASSTAQITLKVKLCTVTGCGSGTVINPISIQTIALATITVTNNAWNVSSYTSTQTAGASSAYEAHGTLDIDLGSLTTAADSIFNDINTATVGTIDSTGGLFLQVTAAASAASTSNSFTGRQLIVEVLN